MPCCCSFTAGIGLDSASGASMAIILHELAAPLCVYHLDQVTPPAACSDALTSHHVLLMHVGGEDRGEGRGTPRNTMTIKRPSPSPTTFVLGIFSRLISPPSSTILDLFMSVLPPASFLLDRIVFLAPEKTSRRADLIN